MTLDRHRIMKPSFRRAAPLVLALAMLVLSAAQPLAAPTQSSQTTLNAPPGVRVSISAHFAFDNTGTNAEITEATFSDTTYYNVARVDNGYAWVEAKTDAELNALPSPPPETFETTVDVTMTNDEGATATGTIALQTTYARASAPPTGASQPTLRPTNPGQDEFNNAPPGVLVSLSADAPANGVFDNAGTNPRITGAVFSTTEYYNTHRIARDMVWVEAKTSAQLNAMSPPPPSPFDVTVDVTMTNDEGQTATARITFRTSYDRVEPTPTPTMYGMGLQPLPGQTVISYAAGMFRNSGTNPRYTSADFSTTDYYSVHEIRDGNIVVQVKTEAQLNALASPPDSPFTVSVEVTMANDEGHTASGTLQIITYYEKAAAAPPAEDPPADDTSGQ